MGGQKSHCGWPKVRGILRPTVQRVGRGPELLGRPSDLGKTDQRSPPVVRGVLDAFGHNRPAHLLEANDEFAASGFVDPSGGAHFSA